MAGITHTTSELAELARINSTAIARKLRTAGFNPVRRTVTAKQVRMLWGHDAYLWVKTWREEKDGTAEPAPAFVPPDAQAIMRKLDEAAGALARTAESVASTASAQRQVEVQVASLQAMFTTMQSTLTEILDVSTTPRVTA